MIYLFHIIKFLTNADLLSFFVQIIRVEVWNGKLDAEMAENRY